VEEVYKIKEMAMLYNNKYHNNIDSKKKGYSNIIVNILDNYKKNYPETKEQYYIQREKEIAAQKEKEKQNKIAEIQEAIDYKNFESANNLINIYKNGDIEEYYFSYFRALIAFEQLKEMELYDFNQDLSPTKKLLESYLAQYKEKNSNYSDNINKDLAYLSAHYPRTIEEYNLIKKELEQKKIEKENALKLDDIKRNFESGNYYVVSDMVNSFPKNTKYEAEVLYYKAMADYKLLENKKNDDNLQYNDIAETKNRITNIINNNQFKNSTFYSDVNNLLTNINSNYPKSQEEWNQIQEEKRKQEEKIRKEQQKDRQAMNPIWIDQKFGTVGAVALDNKGNLAAGTSTGGMTNKKFGRIGDSPIIGAGTYANEQVGVSGTGWGEFFIKATAGRTVAAKMEYQNKSVQTASQETIDEIGKMGGDGGLIALDKDGNIAMPFNTAGMYRGAVTENGEIEVEIYK
jgi:hypothetical protein